MILDPIVAVFAGKDTLRLPEGSLDRFLGLKPVIWEKAGRSPFLASLVSGIIWTESDFISDAKNSSSGASGLMQIMEFHFPTYNLQNGNWRNPELNIEAGIAILKAHGLGKEPLSYVLAGYGGFVNNDPSDYIKKVLWRSAYLLPAFLTD